MSGARTFLAVLALACMAAQAQFVFNLTTTMKMLELSAAAYCDISELETWSCIPCQTLPNFHLTRYVQDTTTWTDGFIGYETESKLIVLSFRGTSNFTEWITDLRFCK